MSQTQVGRDYPEMLLREAEAFRAQVAEPSAGKRPAELLVDQAFRLVNSDLLTIEHLKATGQTPDYATIFQQRFDEKIAAIIYLAKQNLLDIEYGTVQSLETEYARNNLRLMVETLYFVDAVEALIVFYDFAASQREHKPHSLWRNVIVHCLHLMAWMTRHREKVCRFLAERPLAVEMLEELVGHSRDDIARIFRALLDDFNVYLQHTPRTAEPTMHLPPVFITLYQQYETLGGGLEEAWAGGAASALTAHSRITQALAANDMQSLIRWIADGTPAAMMETLQGAIAVMSVEKYLDMLESLLWEVELDDVRRTTLLCELGAINRRHQAGGSPRINHLLMAIVTTDDPLREGIARLAVRELYAVGAWKTLQMIAEKPLLPGVALDVLKSFALQRKLELVPGTLLLHPNMQKALQGIRDELRNIRELMEAAAACPSPEMAQFYLDKLRDLHALPELEQLTRQDRISEQAQQALREAKAADFGLNAS